MCARYYLYILSCIDLSIRKWYVSALIRKLAYLVIFLALSPLSFYHLSYATISFSIISLPRDTISRSSIRSFFLALSISLARFAFSRAHGRIINKTLATLDVQIRHSRLSFLDLNATLVLNAIFILLPLLSDNLYA